MTILNDQLIYEMNLTLVTSGDNNFNMMKFSQNQIERVKSASNRIIIKDENYLIEKN